MLMPLRAVVLILSGQWFYFYNWRVMVQAAPVLLVNQQKLVQNLYFCIRADVRHTQTHTQTHAVTGLIGFDSR